MQRKIKYELSSDDVRKAVVAYAQEAESFYGDIEVYMVGEDQKVTAILEVERRIETKEQRIESLNAEITALLAEED